MIALALAAAVFAVSFKLPETVIAPFVIEPVDGAAPLQASTASGRATAASRLWRNSIARSRPPGR